MPEIDQTFGSNLLEVRNVGFIFAGGMANSGENRDNGKCRLNLNITGIIVFRISSFYRANDRRQFVETFEEIANNVDHTLGNDTFEI